MIFKQMSKAELLERFPMTKTLQEQFIEALIKLGEREVKRTHKRIVYTRSISGVGKYYYIGKSGSLRVGNTSMSSIPVSQIIKDSLLKSLDH